MIRNCILIILISSLCMFFVDVYNKSRVINDINTKYISEIKEIKDINQNLINNDTIIYDKCYYNVKDIFPSLLSFNSNYGLVKTEVESSLDNQWHNWPETTLYDTGKWTIFPFFAFGVWVEDNCKKCPIIYDLIRDIPNLKLATLSRLSPKMSLKPHNGWASHSNNVIRCHFGIDVPDNCYTVVNNLKKYHANNEWLIFDDSKEHYACNGSNTDRVVLIIDIDRPSWIKKGISTIGDSKELIDIVNYFKKSNINTDGITI